MRHYIRIILVCLNFLRPKLEGVATHYLRTPGLQHALLRRTKHQAVRRTIKPPAWQKDYLLF